MFPATGFKTPRTVSCQIGCVSPGRIAGVWSGVCRARQARGAGVQGSYWGGQACVMKVLGLADQKRPHSFREAGPTRMMPRPEWLWAGLGWPQTALRGTSMEESPDKTQGTSLWLNNHCPPSDSPASLTQMPLSWCVF